MIRLIINIVFLLLILIQSAFAQRADVWVFGMNAGLNFNTDPPTLLEPVFQERKQSLVPIYSNRAPFSSSICDCEGNLMFYTSGCQIWNKNQQPMSHGTLVGDCNYTFVNSTNIDGRLTNTVIIPKPADSLKFYVVKSIQFPSHFFNQTSYNGLYYSVVDMNLDSGLGDVDTNNKDIRIDTFSFSGLTVVPHINNIDYWLITKPYADSFFVYKVTQNGIDTLPVKSYGLGDSLWGLVKPTHDYKQLITTHVPIYKSIYSAFIYDFDRSNGTISNPKPLIRRNQHHGDYTLAIETSPNDSLIYLSAPFGTWTTSGIGLYQVERFALDIPSTVVKIKGWCNLRGLQIGVDNKIYANTSDFSSNGEIGVIHEPNKKGIGCNFVPYEYVLSGNQLIGLNMPSLYFPVRNLEFKVFSEANHCHSDSVRFTNISDTHFVSYTWVFGDGDSLTVSDKRTVWHKYDTPGVYYVRLLGKLDDQNYCTARNRFGDTVIVNYKPNAGFIIDSLNIRCLEQEVFVTDTTHGSILSIWDWGDTTAFDTGQTISHIYTQSDTYTITLYSYNQNCTDTAIINLPIQVNLHQQTSVSSLDTIGCVPFETTFIDSSTHALIRYWNWGNSKIDTLTGLLPDTVRHTFTDTGTYLVTYINSNEQGCSDTLVYTITVLPVPKADFSFSTDRDCGFTRLICYNQSQFADSFYWNFGDKVFYPITTTEDSIFQDFFVDSTYEISLRATNSYCFDTISRMIPVPVVPLPNASLYLPDTAGCEPFLATIYDSSTFHSDSVFVDFGDGKTDSFGKNNPIQHTYLHPGQFIPKLVVRNSLGCTDSVTASVTVHPTPTTDFSINDSAQCFDDQEFDFTNNTDDKGETITYLWFVESQVFSTTDLLGYQFQHAGNNQALLKAETSNGCRDSITRKIIIHPSPDANFTFTQPCLEQMVSFTDNSTIERGSINTWKWKFGTLDSSSSQNPQYLFNTPGLYFVSLLVESAQNCSASKTKQLKFNPHVTAPELNRVTVYEKDKILVEWIPPSQGNLESYHLERSIDNSNFNPIHMAENMITDYIDKTADVDARSYIYRVRAKDSCQYQGPYSNIGTSVLLVADTTGEHPKLNWTAYDYWSEGVWGYELYAAPQASPDNIFFNYSILSTFINQENNFTDSVSIALEKYTCYRVVALRENDRTESWSNTLCIPATLFVWIPNAFTPNGDGLNDIFRVSGLNMINFNLKIFNAWGQMLYETNNQQAGWNGEYNGELSPTGVYFYQLSVQGAGSDLKEYSGTVNLIR